MNNWLTANEVMDLLDGAGCKGAELVRYLASTCASRQLVATGFRQISDGNDTASSIDRQDINRSHIWRYFQRAFADGTGIFGAKSTMLETDWDAGSFKYRIERDEGDERPPAEVDCWMNWRTGEASYRVDSVQEVWRSVMFDKNGTLALKRQWVRNGLRNLASVDETERWILEFQPRNSVKAWAAYKNAFGSRAITKVAFLAILQPTWGNQPRGRPRK